MSFKSIAAEKLGSSSKVSFPELGDRKSVNVDTLMKRHPGGVTIMAFNRWTPQGKDPMYPVIFYEEPDTFLWAGKVLQQLLDGWLESYDYDAVACCAALAEEGGCKIKFRRGKTKNGRDIIYVDLA